MHHLLERQINKTFGDKIPKTPELELFLKTVSNTYDNNDKDRQLLEHSFNISSKEFSELNARILKLLVEIEDEKKNVEKKIIERTSELTIANNRLTELDKIKTEFISVAAHQLRTPLSAIKWIFSTLVDDEDNTNLTTEQRSLLMKGFESNERIIRLINEMLVVTRIESGKMSYNLTFIHIEDLIDSCLEDFIKQAKNRNISLTFEEPPTKLPYINIDPDKIRAVIQNLIENAFYYTKDGGSIKIEAKIIDKSLKVFVTDNGIGIPEKQQPGIFNKFFRADNALKARTDGSGLGLYVSKSIIEKHGGVIGFESKEGQGTTFFFTIPYVDDKNKV